MSVTPEKRPDLPKKQVSPASQSASQVNESFARQLELVSMGQQFAPVKGRDRPNGTLTTTETHHLPTLQRGKCEILRLDSRINRGVTVTGRENHRMRWRYSF